MQTFRRKYVFNSEDAVYESAQVRTYTCMNMETKNRNLIILHHLTPTPPEVEPFPRVLQPIQAPTLSEPYSVYALVNCCSEIGRTSENEAMYILRCLSECRLKNPRFYVMSDQGVVASNIEGILPTASPTLFELATSMLGIPQNLVPDENPVCSKEAYAVCRAIRNGEPYDTMLAAYGWKDLKKDKEALKDDQFWIFKARRKEESSFKAEESYYLAWHPDFRLCRCKYIDMTTESCEPQNLQAFEKRVRLFQEGNREYPTVKIFKYVRDAKGIKIFYQIPNQGKLRDYARRKRQHQTPMTDKSIVSLLDLFVKSMGTYTEVSARGLNGPFIDNLCVHNNRLILAEPLLVIDKVEKKLRESRDTGDSFAYEFKEQILFVEKLYALDFEKIDIWAFGTMLYTLFTQDILLFDQNKRPSIKSVNISPGIGELIRRCTELKPEARPRWQGIEVRESIKWTVVENYEVDNNERIQINLSGKKEKKSSSVKDSRLRQEKVEETVVQLQPVIEEEPEKIIAPLPVQLASRLKRIKLVAKVTAVLLLYIFVFFKPFLGSTLDLLSIRSYYTITQLNLIDNSDGILSTTTVITNNGNFFLLNDIDFSAVQNTYYCMNNFFDPINNPTYSLLNYIQSNSFLGFMLCGWLCAFLICLLRGLSIWRGGISARSSKSTAKFWIVYAFNELTIAGLLYAHFYLFEFFYFSGSWPCLSLKTFNGVDPLFDSSLYLLLSNTNGFMQYIFSTLGILSILLMLSATIYACSPRFDLKYFFSVPSILLRIVPYVLVFIVCRIGAFNLFAPTAVNDKSKILPALLSGSVTGVFGIIPELFMLICLLVELALELALYYCERKAAESDQLGRLFSVKEKKVAGQQEQENLNNMSIVNQSKHMLIMPDKQFI